MRRLLLIAGTLVMLGACSSGGCDSDGTKPSAPAKDPPSLGGGGGSHGGTGEAISFQGLGKDAPPPPGPGQGPAAPGTKAATGALGGSAPEPPQTVICGGFPNLAADCKTDPAFANLKQKCCPTGTIDQCTAIPGGARLIGRACTAQGSTFTSTPAPGAAAAPASGN